MSIISVRGWLFYVFPRQILTWEDGPRDERVKYPEIRSRHVIRLSTCDKKIKRNSRLSMTSKAIGQAPSRVMLVDGL